MGVQRRRRVVRELGLVGVRELLEREVLLLRRHLVGNLVVVVLRELHGLGPADRTERLGLQGRDLSRVGPVTALELQVLADGVVEQSHRAQP